MKSSVAHRYEVRVFAEDVDYMGIVYHANYLRFYERARTEMLRSQQLLLSKLAKNDTLFAITQINIKYLSPARLDDLLKINSVMNKTGYCRFICEQKMYNSSDKLISEVQVEVVCVDTRLKPKRFPQNNI